MATIFMAWELGGGLGHVARLRPLAAELLQRGHRIIAAVRDLAAAQRVLGDLPIGIVQAPYKHGQPKIPHCPVRSYAQLLHNVGFEDSAELASRIKAWRSLVDIVAPDLILADHSPTALLATHDGSARRIVVGTGFSSPPITYPLRQFRSWPGRDAGWALNEENRTLTVANDALRQQCLPPLQLLGDLFAEVDANVFLTYAELDHFGSRHGVKYWGTSSTCRGIAPRWPRVEGKRTFVYVKKSKGLPELLQVLMNARQPTIVYGDWVNEQIRQRFQSPHLIFEDRPLDLTSVAETCELAVLNGTHGTTAALLSAGIPILQLPIYLEQLLVSQRTAKMGAGLVARRDRSADIAKKFDSLLQNPRYRENARVFRAKYAPRHSRTSAKPVVDFIESRMNARPADHRANDSRSHRALA